MAAGTEVGFYTLPVIVVMKGIDEQINKELGDKLKPAAKKAGEDYAKSMGEGRRARWRRRRQETRRDAGQWPPPTPKESRQTTRRDARRGHRAVYGVLAGWLVVDPCAVPLEPPVDPYGSHSCAQCGELFAARRFDARFCSAACRPSSMAGSR